MWWFSCSVVFDSCNTTDCTLLGSSVHGVSQGRILEWVAISFSRVSSWPRDQTRVSRVAGSLLHCRRILYNLSHPGSPFIYKYGGEYQLYNIDAAAATAAKSLESCPTLCDPIDGSPPGSPVPRILQARTLEWIAVAFSNAWKWKVKWKSLSHVRLLTTPWTAAYQAPPSMGFSRDEYWSGEPLPSPNIDATS